MTRTDENGNILYKGGWLNMKNTGIGLLSAIVRNGITKTLECLEFAQTLPDDQKGLKFKL